MEETKKIIAHYNSVESDLTEILEEGDNNQPTHKHAKIIINIHPTTTYSEIEGSNLDIILNNNMDLDHSNTHTIKSHLLTCNNAMTSTTTNKHSKDNITTTNIGHLSTNADVLAIEQEKT